MEEEEEEAPGHIIAGLSEQVETNRSLVGRPRLSTTVANPGDVHERAQWGNWLTSVSQGLAIVKNPSSWQRGGKVNSTDWSSRYSIVSSCLSHPPLLQTSP